MSTTGKSYTFTHAITRAPSQSAVHGLRAVDIGAPDLQLMQQHHADYIKALKSTGVDVLELPALEAYPDGVFVEDTALCLQEGAIIMRPGAPTRLGEAQEMAPHLSSFYDDVRVMEAPAFIEGGDILTTESEILVGTSARTNREAVEALQHLVIDWGYKVRLVETPKGVLHFKTDCSLIDEETVLSTKRLAASGCFEAYRIIHTAEGEEAAANAIRFNELVIMPAGFPRTADILRDAGYKLVEIGNTEAAKLDGGMSCLSLRFSPKPKN